MAETNGRKSNGNKNLVYQITTVLAAMGLLGGGGYVGMDAIKSNVAVVETQVSHTNDNLNKLDETVGELTTQIAPLVQQVATLQKQMDIFSDEFRQEFRAHLADPELHLSGLAKLKSDIIEKINIIQQKITRIEAKLFNGQKE
jgi:chromosome segregation ATPase